MKAAPSHVARVCLSKLAFCFASVLAGLWCLPQSGSAQTNLLRYTFDEATSGTTAALDKSGSSPQANGTFSGTGTRTTPGAGGVGVAAFDTGASGGYIDGGNIAKLNGLQKFTLTAWVNLKAAPVNGNSFMGKINNTANSGFGFLYATPNAGTIAANNFAFRLRVNSAGISASVDSSADAIWVFVAVTYDGSASANNVKFYSGKAAQAVAQLGTTRTLNQGTAATTTDAFQVGRNSSAGGPQSWIDDVRVYNDVLALADLEAVRLANVPPTTALWWDRNTTSAGAGGPSPNGVWSGSGVLTPNNSWSSDSTGSLGTQQWTDGNAANFAAGTDGTGSYTVTVSNAPTASAINIEEGAVLFSRNSVMLISGGSIDVAGGASATFDSTTIAGTVGLTKTGAGTLTLAGANTYSGTTAVSGGTLSLTGSINNSAAVNISAGSLSLGASDKLADSATVSVSGSGSLNLNGNGDTVGSFNLSAGSLDGSGTLTAATYGLSGGTVNANLGAGTLNSSGAVALNGTAGAGTVNVTAGTLTLGSANRLSDSGAVNVSGGTLAIGGNDDTVGAVTLSSGAITGSGGTLTGSSYEVQSGSVSANLGGSANLAKTTGGTVTLTVANTYGGDTTISGGTLALSGSGAISSSANISVGSGATLDVTGRTDGTLTLASGQTLKGEGQVGGNITALSGASVKPGASIGTLTVASGGNVTLQSGSTTEMEVNRGATPNADKVQGIGTLTQGGTLSIINNGAALQLNDSFTLLSATTYSGEFAAISPANPNTDLELAWDQPALKTSGVLRVHHVPYATNLVIFRGKGISWKVKLSELFPSTDPLDADTVGLESFTAGSQAATITTNATYLFYTPANNNNDSFDYTVTDGRGGKRTKTITISLTNSVGSVSVTNSGGGSMTLSFYGIPGYQYVVQRSCSDLSSWVDMVTNTASGNGLIQYTDTPGGGCTPAFYRMRSE